MGFLVSCFITNKKIIAVKDHLGIFFILDNVAVFRLMNTVHCINMCPDAEGIYLGSGSRTPCSL